MSRKTLFKTSLLLAASLATALVQTGCDNAKKPAAAATTPGTPATATAIASGTARQSLNCKIEISQRLQDIGVKHGALAVERLSKSKGANLSLSLYLIFEKKFEGTIQLRILDSNGLETGRALLEDHSADPGEASWQEFDLDEKTLINEHSTVSLELVKS